MFDEYVANLLGSEEHPDISLAKCKFLLTLPEYASDNTIHAKITEAIKKYNMAPWYELICYELGWPVDTELLKTLTCANEAVIEELSNAIEYAEENLGDMELLDAYVKKAEYYTRIGDKCYAFDLLEHIYAITMSVGQKIDILFYLLRVGFFFMYHDAIRVSLIRANVLIERGGDWDRRNRLKVYFGLYCVMVRNFKKACSLFLDTVTTFTSYELVDYNTFICYTVYTSLVSLPRNQLREKVMNKSEIQEVLHSQPVISDLLNSFCNCAYADFFKNLAKVEITLKEDYFFHPHYRYYIREMRILAYSQLLESYSSLTLKYMADSFEVTVDFIEKDLSEFVAAGRLNCKIDRIGGCVETTWPDSRNAQFNLVVKHGDVLLNRVQKLSRVVDI